MINEDQLVVCITQILGQDNEVRKQNEAALQQYRDTYPNEFITSFLSLCRNQELRIRQFSSVHLRNCLSNFTPKSFKNIWSMLNQQTQELVKNDLFVLLNQETNSNVRNQLADAIGEIGGSLYEEAAKNGWPNLLPTLWQLFLTPKNELIESGFKILGSLFTYAPDMFVKNTADINALFNQGLVNQDIRIRTATIQAIGNFVTSTDPKQYKMFEDLLPIMIQSTHQILLENEDLGEDAMEVFSDIVDAEPKFLRKHFKSFFDGLQAIFYEKKIEQGIKRIGTETLLVLAERSPKQFKTDSQLIYKVVEMIFFHMIQISEEVSEEWQTPAEGFNDDIEQDDDCETTRFGMSSIDRLIESIGQKEMLPILSQIVNQLLQHQDWRYKYAAIMALSQVGEYIDEVSEIKPIVDLVMNLLNDANPMIRYAVCHAIGQISDDMKPKFQDSFVDTLLPTLINRLQGETVPRVTSHILAALTNFVEGAETGIDKYTPSLVQYSVAFITNSISIVKENAMSVVAATAEASKQNFIPYFNEIMPLLFQVLNTHTGKAYRQLKGQTIEAITLIASAVKQEVFQPYLEQTINVLVSIQEGQFEAVDPQKSYVLSGWQRLCLVCPDLLAPYLQRILPSLFNLVKVVFDLQRGQLQPNSADTTGDKDEAFHTYDNEEAEIAINMLAVFIEELKDKFFPYVETCTQLIVPLCEFNTDENIRRSSAKCLVSLIENVKSTGQQSGLFQGAKYFLGVILEAAKKEFDPEVIIDQVDCLKEIVDTVTLPFMTAQEVNELSDQVFKLLLESDQRKAENEKIKKDEEIDDDEKDMIEEENQTEEELHVKIAEFIGVLFKTHRDQVQPLFDLICSSILPKVLDPQLSAKMHQFGLFLIDDIIEHLGFAYAGAKFIDFAKALSLYANDKVCYVRQAAVYGIGIQAQATPQDQYPQTGGILLKAVADSLKITKNNEDTEKVYGNCRDNSIAALGKIIKYQSVSLGNDFQEALQTWLYLLPLNYDKPEAQIQHDLLADLIIHNGNVLLNGRQENALQTLRTLAEVVNTKKSNANLDQKIMQALRVFESLDVVKGNWQAVFGMLNIDNQNKLLNIAGQAK